MDHATQILQQITRLLTLYTTSAPIIFGAVASIASIIRGVTGEGPTLSQSLMLVRQQLAQNRAFGEAELARLDGLISDRT